MGIGFVTQRDLDDLRGRISRLSRKLNQKGGEGFSRAHAFPDGSTHRYRVTGVKQTEEVEDELIATFVWIWSVKDYLKELARQRGKNPEGVENIVNAYPALQIVADIANGAKHGKLKDSRSGRFPRLSRTTLVVPREALSSLTFAAQEVTIAVGNADKTRFETAVKADDGEKLGEAAAILSAALHVWETQGIPYALDA